MRKLALKDVKTKKGVMFIINITQYLLFIVFQYFLNHLRYLIQGNGPIINQLISIFEELYEYVSLINFNQIRRNTFQSSITISRQ